MDMDDALKVLSPIVPGSACQTGVNVAETVVGFAGNAALPFLGGLATGVAATAVGEGFKKGVCGKSYAELKAEAQKGCEAEGGHSEVLQSTNNPGEEAGSVCRPADPQAAPPATARTATPPAARSPAGTTARQLNQQQSKKAPAVATPAH